MKDEKCRLHIDDDLETISLSFEVLYTRPADYWWHSLVMNLQQVASFPHFHFTHKHFTDKKWKIGSFFIYSHGEQPKRVEIRCRVTMKMTSIDYVYGKWVMADIKTINKLTSIKVLKTCLETNKNIFFIINFLNFKK